MSTLYYDTFISAPTYPVKRSKWFALSTVLHASLIAASFALALPQIGGDGGGDNKSPGTMEIEVISTGAPVAAPAPVSVAKPMPVAKPELINKDDVVVYKPIAKAKKVIAAKPKAVAKTAKISAKSWDSEVAVPTLDTSSLEKELSDTHRSAVQASNTQFDADELNSDFAAIDGQTNSKVDSALAELDAQSESAEQEHLEQMSAISAAQQAEFDRLDRAQKQAAEKAARAAAAAAASASRGQGGSGLAEGEAPAGGPKPGEIRALGDLRQMPGNQRPQYDYPDRLAGRQGKVTFYAYISKSGKPVKLLMASSTGHRTLDYKTLKAFKNWRFYPGQEGWVEMPFRWDLKGGPQEMPATLRRKISRR